jgi:hypothetical protein
MSRHGNSPGGALARWLYGLAAFAALFTGMAQMPIMKRYYIADVPGLAWTANFFTTSTMHYLAAMLLLLILAWRLALDIRAGDVHWSWGPRSGWGWILLLVLAITGGAKVARNAGIYIPPVIMVYLDLFHLGSAMTFMMTAIVSFFRPRREAMVGTLR